MAAMSDTAGSSFAHWAGLFDPEPIVTSDVADDGNVAVAAAATSPTSTGRPTTNNTNKALAVAARHHQAGIEGPRPGKPARRRSRASRRAPVTLLNTDTSNFRAMVQQFTGIPAPPAGAFGGVPLINFAGDYSGFPPHAANGLMSSAFDNLHHPTAAPLHDQLRRQQQHPHQFGYDNSPLHGAGDIFASSAEDRMLLQSIQAAQIPAASALNNTSLGFFA